MTKLRQLLREQVVDGRNLEGKRQSVASGCSVGLKVRQLSTINLNHV